MAKINYIKTGDEAFAAQMAGFKANLPTYAVILGISPAEIAAQAADTDYFDYILKGQAAMQKGAQQWSVWKRLLRGGGTPPPDGEPLPPVFPPVVAAVALGIEVRFRALAQRIKTHPNYNASIGEALGIGGYFNAFTSEESTCFHARVHHEHFTTVLDVLMDMFANSRFAPADVAKEREVIKEEIAMYRDQPAQHVHEVLNATLWPDHPLGRSITGTSRGLDAIRRPELTGFLRTHYLAANTVLVVTGNIRHAEAVKAATHYARYFRPGSTPAFATAPDDQRAPRLKLVTQKTEQAQLALGIRTCSRHDERRFALRLLNAIFGENMSSRLFQLIREDLGLAYNIYSSPSFYADAGDLVIAAGLDTGNLPRVVQLIRRELQRCTEHPPSAAELRRARDFAIGQFDLSLESTENQMNFVGEQVLGFGRITPPESTKRRLATVTACEIRAVAADFFRPERMNLAIISPLKSDRVLARALA